MPQDTDKQPPGERTFRGEDVAGRRFPEGERSFADKEKPAERKARVTTGKGEIRPHPAAEPADASDPHTERQLDNALKETFPASDPVSISPGAD